ncbi:hypothetical protein PVK06_005810 [Gossypium arboreum]|uniref:Uncharacterized protein n=1 Tax=Gossypium arboreum TaxID=29729 RepID=A0ABR0QVK2_GOSAR|nr:hypothetical protein PVK06_005810 [Gossypium arboreum]
MLECHDTCYRHLLSFQGIGASSSSAISPCSFGTHFNREMREHWCSEHSRCILPVEHEAEVHFLPHLLHCPCLSPSNRVTQEGSHQPRPIYDSSSMLLRAPEYSGTVLIAHSHSSDVPTGHPKYAPHAND